MSITDRRPRKRHKAAGFGLAPTWHELVQPPDPHNRPDTARTHRRREERGQVVTLTPKVIEQAESLQPRASRRAAKGRGFNPGALVLHRRKPIAGAEREAHRAAVTVEHPMTGGNTVRRAPINTGAKAAARRADNRGQTRRTRREQARPGLVDAWIAVDS